MQKLGEPPQPDPLSKEPQKGTRILHIFPYSRRRRNLTSVPSSLVASTESHSSPRDLNVVRHEDLYARACQFVYCFIHVDLSLFHFMLADVWLALHGHLILALKSLGLDSESSSRLQTPCLTLAPLALRPQPREPNSSALSLEPRHSPVQSL